MLTFFEDYVVGAVLEAGETKVDAQEVHAFALRYDPQPIHVDAAFAAASPYGGIIGSGWQTAAFTMRMIVDEVIDARYSLGSPGIGALAWRVPVRPGDVLRVRAHVKATRRSQSKPDRGFVTIDVETVNQNDEIVLRAQDWICIVRTRAS